MHVAKMSLFCRVPGLLFLSLRVSPEGVTVPIHTERTVIPEKELASSNLNFSNHVFSYSC